MALTQIGTGGLKDDAVTDAKLPANSVGNSEMKDDAVGVAELSATGTASSSTFLRGDNSWVTPTDTNTQLTEEQVEDFVGGMVTGNTETGITVTYEDSDGTLDFVVATQTPEGTTVLSTGESGGTKFLREDGDGSCSWQAVPAGVTQENVEDWVGGMVTGNTETGITVTYEDSDGTLDFVVGTLNQDTTGTANTADHVKLVDNESTNENNCIIFAENEIAADTSVGLETDGDLTYNPSTGTLTSTKFAGDGSALTGVSSSSADGCIWKNTLTISNAHTIAATEGAHSVGPITLSATVTVNGRWVIS